jgi:Polyketide cyclase / dehydrase and lipid transport.
MTITDSGVDSSETPRGRRRTSPAEPVAAVRDVVIQRSVTIYAPVHDVFERICDISEGSLLHEDARIFGVRASTDTVVTAFEPDRRWAFEHVSGPIPVTGEFVVEPLVHGTQLTYTLKARLVGVRRHGAGFASRRGHRAMTRSLDTLRARLESPPGPSASGSPLGV